MVAQDCMPLHLHASKTTFITNDHHVHAAVTTTIVGMTFTESGNSTSAVEESRILQLS